MIVLRRFGKRFMKLQRLYSLTRQTINKWHMIDDGDKIALGVSGGKDSLSMLYALSGLRRFYPAHFDIEVIMVDLGFDNFDTAPAQSLCGELNVNCSIVHTQIAPVVFDYRNEKNPCSLCATLRKGALNNKACELGCNKVAYAHNRDDLIETMLMCLIYEGRFSTFEPVTHLDRSGLTVIRPMIGISESDIAGFARRYDLPVVKNPCPADGHTKREYARRLLLQIEHDNPGAADRMYTAVTKSLYKETKE